MRNVRRGKRSRPRISKRGQRKVPGGIRHIARVDQIIIISIPWARIPFHGGISRQIAEIQGPAQVNGKAPGGILQRHLRQLLPPRRGRHFLTRRLLQHRLQRQPPRPLQYFLPPSRWNLKRHRALEQSVYSHRFQLEPPHFPPAANGNWDKGQGASESKPRATANKSKQKSLGLSVSSSLHFPSDLARIFHELLAPTTDMAVLPGLLRCRTLRRTVQVRLGSNTLRLPGGTPISMVS